MASCNSAFPFQKEKSFDFVLNCDTSILSCALSLCGPDGGVPIPGLDDHEFYMKMALSKARQAARGCEVPVGAVVVARSGHVLSAAHNAPVGRKDPTAHAEVLALRSAAHAVKNYRLPGCSLYVTLEPCLMCLGALVHARVRTLVYGASDPKGGVAGGAVDLTRLPCLNHTLQIVGGVLAEESSEILRAFFRERRRGCRPRGEVPKWP